MYLHVLIWGLLQSTSSSSPATSSITAGGGFSTLNPQPSWQTTAVQKYLSKSSPVSGYNTKGRAYPDISLLANQYQIIVGGQVAGADGTSASTPAFAAMSKYLFSLHTLHMIDTNY